MLFSESLVFAFAVVENTVLLLAVPKVWLISAAALGRRASMYAGGEIARLILGRVLEIALRGAERGPTRADNSDCDISESEKREPTTVLSEYVDRGSTAWVEATTAVVALVVIVAGKGDDLAAILLPEVTDAGAEETAKLLTSLPPRVPFRVCLLPSGSGTALGEKTEERVSGDVDRRWIRSAVFKASVMA